AARRNLRSAIIAPSLACLFMALTLALLRRELNARRVAEGHLALLLELGDLLQASRTLDEAYEVCRKYLPRFFEGSAGVLALLDTGGAVVTRASWGRSSSEHVPHGFAVDACWALRRGQPFASEAGDGGVRCAHVGAPGADALCLPLAAHGEQIGALSISSPPGTAAKLRTLAESVGEQVSLALGNLILREELKAQSIRDPLTGLFNRRYTEETLERELKGAARSKAPVGVLMIDVDHFKRVNDTHGHDGGDLVLKAIADVLRARTRGHDVVSRLGGEELLVILPGASLEAAEEKAEALRAAIAKLELSHRGRRIEVTASFGVSAFPEHGSHGAELTRAADQALYTAKRTGRDRVVTAAAPATATALSLN
ncbi:MAG: GGDEF domain-containing protein, partial [Myxococcaceae bacterium]|nr:GGDEF domain-containing protein [Myxococcaceae bacterium]